VKGAPEFHPLRRWSVAPKIVEAVEEACIDQKISAGAFADLGIEGAACIGVDGQRELFPNIGRAATGTVWVTV
jgi:hypothetical protein